MSTAVYTVNLMLRFLRVANDSSCSDATSVIGAILLLSMKTQKEFKPKNFKKLVRSAYCQVFSREESTVGSSSDPYLQRTLDKEAEVLHLLRHDLFVIDSSMFFFGFESRETLKHYTLLEWEAYSRASDDCMELAVTLASFLSPVWSILPQELSLVAAFVMAPLLKAIIVFEMHLFIPSLIRNTLPTPTPDFLNVLRTSVNQCHLTKYQIAWALSLFAQSLILVSPEEIAWLRVGAETSATVPSTEAWRTMLGLLSKWFLDWSELAKITEPSLPPPPPPQLSFASASASAAIFKPVPMMPGSLKTRLPWVQECNNGSIIDVNDTSSIVTMGKDLFSVDVATNALAESNLTHVLQHLPPSSSSSNLKSLTLRAWPNAKDAHREARKVSLAELEGVGCSANSLQELNLMQQLHYLSAGAAGVCRFIAAPLAIANISGSFHIPTSSSTMKATTPNSNIKSSDRNAEIAVLISLSSAKTSSATHSNSIQNIAKRFLIFPPVLTSLQFLLPQIVSAYPSENDSSSSLASMTPPPPFSADMCRELCRDLLSAIKHCSDCEVYFKWILLEQVWVSGDGRLLLGGLSGAVKASSANATHVLTSIAAAAIQAAAIEKEKLQKEREQLEREQREREEAEQLALVASGEISSSKHRKREREKEKQLAKEKFKEQKEKEKMLKKKQRHSTGGEDNSDPTVSKEGNLPSLTTTAPEIILGGQADATSSVYCAVAICTYIITGKPLFKAGATEEKHVQYTYRTLGTPKMVGFSSDDMLALPMLAVYGKQIKGEDGETLTEGRCRTFKLLQKQCPAQLLSVLSGEIITKEKEKEKGNSNSKGSSKSKEHVGDSDQGGLLDMLCGGFHFAAHRRLSAENLLSMRFFIPSISPAERTRSVRQLLSAISSFKPAVAPSPEFIDRVDWLISTADGQYSNKNTSMVRKEGGEIERDNKKIRY